MELKQWLLSEAVKDITEIESKIYQIDPKPTHGDLTMLSIAELDNLAPFVS